MTPSHLAMDLPDLRSRYISYYAGVAENAEPYLTSGQRRPGAWMERLTLEEKNLTAALEMAFHVSTALRDRQQGLRIAGSLFWFWNFRGNFNDSISWLKEAAKHLDSLDPADSVRGKVLYGLGGLQFLRAEYEPAGKHIDAAARAFQQAGDPLREGFALIIAGMVRLEQGQAPAAATHLDRAIDLLRDRNNWGYALALNDRARVHPPSNYVLATHALQESLRIWEQMQDLWGQALTLNTWGVAAYNSRQYEVAAKRHAEALKIQEETNDVWGIAASLRDEADCLMALDRLPEALGRLRRSLEMHHRLRRRQMTARCFESLARAALNLKDIATAAEFLEVANVISAHSGSGKSGAESVRYEQLVEDIATALSALGQKSAYASAMQRAASTPLDDAVNHAFTWIDKHLTEATVPPHQASGPAQPATVVVPDQPAAPNSMTAPVPVPLNPWQIVLSMRPENWPGLYVIGSFDRLITFYAQQARALVLVRALFQVGELKPGHHVGIVGGGASGVTAAVAAAMKGCYVTLFEEGDSVLHLQASARHRLLHPHIYDWPEPGCTDSDARLPLLNWSANYADKVVEGLVREFDSHRSKFGDRLNPKTKTRITAIEPGADRRVRVIGNDGDINSEFDLVIIAIGFGLEQQPGAVSYWSAGDNLDGPYPAERKILISGAGDGGLIDVVRATLRSPRAGGAFRHQDFLSWLAPDPQFQSLTERMREIEVRARNEYLRNYKRVNLYQEYQNLALPSELLQRIGQLKRSDTTVTFNYKNPEIFLLESAMLNRALVYLLIRQQMIKRILGSVDEVENAKGAAEKVVHFKRPGGQNSFDRFDIVVSRWGPPPEHFEARLPAIYSACKALGGKIAELQLTGRLDAETAEWYSSE